MKNLLKELDIKIVIISRGRSDSINTHNLLPNFIEVVVPKSEVEDYKKTVTENPIFDIDDNVQGLGQLRNHLIDIFEEETVIMLDDDISQAYCISGRSSRRIDDNEELLQILINTAVMALDLGVGVFGYFQGNIMQYNGTQPFSFTGWVGGVIGVIGKEIRFTNRKFKVDIDFCLKNMYEHRILFIDNRYQFTNKMDNNKGGNSAFRTMKQFEDDVKTLKKVWGKYVRIDYRWKTQVSIKTNVIRKQPIIL